MLKKGIEIISDENGNKIVKMNALRFKKKVVNWDEVEKILQSNYLEIYQYCLYKILESNDDIHIDKKFADEFSNSEYTVNLKGSNAKAKANLVQSIPEIISIATNKRYTQNHKTKHKKSAKKGWYRYTTRFSIPVLDSITNESRDNVYIATLIVKIDKNNNLYLYDVINIKREKK